MTDNIELKYFSRNFAKDDDIEEYHEIEEEAFHEPNALQHRVSKIRSKSVTEEDFFIQYDVKSIDKKPGKKKHSKKKATTSNLMDIINSELACDSVPVTEELVITTVDYSMAQRSTYLQNSGIRNMFKKPFGFLPENGTGGTGSPGSICIPEPGIKNLEPGPVLHALVRTYDTMPQYAFKNCGSSHRNTKVSEGISFFRYGDKLLTAVLNPVYPNVIENTTSDYQPIPVQYTEAAKFEEVVARHESDNRPSKFLDFTVKNIKFLHHHDFCLEELLCTKLVECYNEYVANENAANELIRDIKVIRETRDGLKEDIVRISVNNENIRFDETVRKYTLKLLKLKDKYLMVVDMRKEIMHKIGSLWSDVLLAREKSKSMKTPYVIDIENIEKDSDEFEKEWAEVFNTEYADKLDRLEYDYVTRYLEYKKAKADKSDLKISKPKLEFEEDILKNESETIANKIITKHRISIILRRDDKMMLNLRKSEITMLRSYSFKIYVDDVFVCESETYRSNLIDKYNIEFKESFSVEILPNNTTISIELCEQNDSVSCLKFNLNNVKITSVNAEYKTVTFVYNNIVEPNPNHVGSGHNIKEIAVANKLRLKSSNVFKANLYTSCEISLQIGWNEKLCGNETEEIKSSMKVGQQIKRLLNGVEEPNMDLLKDIIEYVYGTDVSEDEEFINSLRNLCKMGVYVDDTIPVDEESPEFYRLKLLHLRNNGGFTAVEDKTIPLLASQISTEQLRCLQASTENEFEVQFFDRQDMDPLEIQRFIGAKYVEKLNKNMLKNLREHLLKKTHKDVVRDFKDLSLRSFFSNQTTLSLALSSSTKQQRVVESLGQEQELRVTVFRALGLKDRSPIVTDNDEEDDDGKIAGYKIRPLRPFVRVSYHKSSAQTTSAIGCHPTWNQTLKIKTKLAPLSNVQVNIFDEQRVPMTERLELGTLQYRCHYKWLGCLQVPVKTVLDTGMIKGTFKISSPPVILGYETTQTSSHSLIPEVSQLLRKESAFVSLQISSSLSHLGGSQGYNQPVPADPEDYIIRHLNSFVSEYTNDFPSRNISLTYIDSTGRNKSVTHFLQPIPPPDYECFPKNPKSGSAVSKSSGFSSSSRRREEERSEGSAYSGLSGKGDGLTRVMDACVRYVSLIPCYEVVESHVVTLLGVELLKVLNGSPLDHTILLASYFLHLGLKCYIATGFSLPRGLGHYVLTKYDLNNRRIALANDQHRNKGWFGRNVGVVWYVYDAVNGERFELRDVSCPLKTVDYVFDNENIWVNMQYSVDCESVSFDFNRSSDWQPVFDKTIFVMKLPVVTDSSLYSAPADVDNLRQALEAKIRSKVQQWRPHVKTIWNRYCSTLFRELLPFWEYHAFNPTEQKPGLGQRLKQLMVTHKMFGFPLNMTYVNMKSVISTVKATAVHVTGDPNAEFALGLEVYSYPNNVISVWVFLANITRI